MQIIIQHMPDSKARHRKLKLYPMKFHPPCKAQIRPRSLVGQLQCQFRANAQQDYARVCNL